MSFKCCVTTCTNSNKYVKMHCFPKEQEIFKKWVDAVQRTDIDISKRKNYRVCDVHFSELDKFKGNHNRTNLKFGSVPTLFLLSTTSTKELQLFHSEEQSSIVATEYSEMDINIHNSEVEQLKTVAIEESVENSADKKGTPNLLKSVNVTRCRALSPKARKLYHIATELQATARRLNKANLRYKKRIQLAKNYAESDEFLKTKINQTSLNFFNSQLRLQMKKSRGRRFTVEDKIFSLSLLKQSPKGYKLLQRTFALPSRKTLMNLLNKVPFNCGLNDAILRSIEATVKKMKPLDRYCSLLFDEMSLQAGLTYDRKEDTILGFKDCGEGRVVQFSDHAMVFVARGLRRKWKQPIAYFFTSGGMSSADIVRNIKQIITALQGTGLKIVATVCDQVGTNCAAINMLKQETTRRYTLQGKENRLFGFEINGEEIIPL